MIPNIELVKNVNDDGLVFAYSINATSIFNPYTSECGRFKVEPSVYGLSKAQADALHGLNVAFNLNDEV